MTPDNTSVDDQARLERKSRVDLLFNQIAFIAEVKENDPQLRDELIKPMSEALWAITQEQEKLHELDWKRIGV
jgi:hypothetical protein